MKYDFLPITLKEMRSKGWDSLDVILITGDAYVDHPSFGVAVIARLLESFGLKIGIIPQPAWQDDGREFQKFGKPRLFFGVTAGNMDSMVNHYTAAKRKRSDDAYTPAAESGKRPDYACVVYSKILKKLYPDTPIVLGGIEASLRRFVHYDYWQDKLLSSILEQSGADLLLYGMAEKAITELVNLVDKGVPFQNIKTICQTAFLMPKNDVLPKNKNWEDFKLHSFKDVENSKIKFAENSKIIEIESNKKHPRRIIQELESSTLIVNPPFSQMTEKEIDAIYDLPFTRLPHHKYSSRPAIPAYNMIKHSVNIHRGCFGACSFCTISAHQGKFICSRSENSILKEVEKITQMPDFKGTISDLGAPSANMYKMEGIDKTMCEKCVKPSCINPKICSNLDTSHKKLTELYKKALKIDKIKHIFIGSGIRYDLLTPEFNDKADKEDLQNYLQQLVKHHVSGRLKVAPEHSSDEVLKIMRKPSFSYFEIFKRNFDNLNMKFNLNQQIIPYFISSHPGSRVEDIKHLIEKTQKMGLKTEQVQDFTPTPMTISTDIFYTGLHPYTMKNVYCPRTEKEKRLQNDILKGKIKRF